MSITSGATCGVPYAAAANPVYQTQWVLITGHPSGTTWLELGTGHQCSGVEYWFGGYGQTGTWHSLVTHSITGGTLHSFFLYSTVSSGTQYWNWHVGRTVLFGPWAKAWKGFQLEAGLESYYSGLKTVYHTYNLNYQVNTAQTWHAWAGTKKGTVGATMCYRKTATGQIYFGENTVC